MGHCQKPKANSHIDSEIQSKMCIDGLIRILNRLSTLGARNERFHLVVDRRGAYELRSTATASVAFKFPFTPETILNKVYQTDFNHGKQVGLFTRRAARQGIH